MQKPNINQGLIYQVRLFIAEWLLGIALEILPKGKEKNIFAHLIINYFDQTEDK